MFGGELPTGPMVAMETGPSALFPGGNSVQGEFFPWSLCRKISAYNKCQFYCLIRFNKMGRLK